MVTQILYLFTLYLFTLNAGSIIGFFIIVLVVTVLVHLVIAICWKRKSQGNIIIILIIA